MGIVTIFAFNTIKREIKVRESVSHRSGVMNAFLFSSLNSWPLGWCALCLSIIPVLPFPSFQISTSVQSTQTFVVQEATAPTLRAVTTARVCLGTTLQQTGVPALVCAILNTEFHILRNNGLEPMQFTPILQVVQSYFISDLRLLLIHLRTA